MDYPESQLPRDHMIRDQSLAYQIRLQELEVQNLELSIRTEELFKENATLKR